MNSTHIKVRILPTFYGKAKLIQQHKIEGSRKNNNHHPNNIDDNQKGSKGLTNAHTLTGTIENMVGGSCAQKKQCLDHFHVFI